MSVYMIISKPLGEGLRWRQLVRLVSLNKVQPALALYTRQESVTAIWRGREKERERERERERDSLLCSLSVIIVL